MQQGAGSSPTGVVGDANISTNLFLLSFCWRLVLTSEQCLAQVWFQRITCTLATIGLKTEHRGCTCQYHVSIPTGVYCYYYKSCKREHYLCNMHAVTKCRVQWNSLPFKTCTEDAGLLICVYNPPSPPPPTLLARPKCPKWSTCSQQIDCPCVFCLIFVICKWWDALDVFHDTECPYWDNIRFSSVNSRFKILWHGVHYWTHVEALGKLLIPYYSVHPAVMGTWQNKKCGTVIDMICRGKSAKLSPKELRLSNSKRAPLQGGDCEAQELSDVSGDIHYLAFLVVLGLLHNDTDYTEIMSQPKLVHCPCQPKRQWNKWLKLTGSPRAFDTVWPKSCLTLKVLMTVDAQWEGM